VIIADAATDTAFSLGAMGAAAGSAAIAGLWFGPVGSAIAGLSGGIAYIVATDVVTVDEQTFRGWTTEQVRNLAGCGL